MHYHEVLRYLLFMLDKEDESYHARRLLIDNFYNSEYVKRISDKINLDPDKCKSDAMTYLLNIYVDLRKELINMTQKEIIEVMNNNDKANEILDKYKFKGGADNDIFLRCT